MLRKPIAFGALLWVTFAAAASAVAQTAGPQGLHDILTYIDRAWPALTRSMQDCKTVSEEKFATQPVLYVPADVAVPSEAAALAGRCHITVEPLPERIQKLGTADPSKITRPGLLYLPNPYVVPGGFFNEMYGWDSYFIIRGLVRAGKLKLARGMVENFFYEIEHYGAVLNANRTYYLTRSQPPFLSSMVLAVYEAEKAAGRDDHKWLERAYGYVARDHEMWTSGEKLAGSTGLSRYYDYGSGPAPESFGQENNYYGTVEQWVLQHRPQGAAYLAFGADAEKLPAAWPRYQARLCEGTARGAQCGDGIHSSEVSLTPDYYKGDRAMRESGYDISFRFGPFGGETHHFAALDLNCLLYKEERDLEQMAMNLGRKQDARRWAQQAETRKQRINRLMWDEQRGLYFDYDFVRGRRSAYVYITTFHALWTRVASKRQAERIRQNLKLFEQPGGLVTSRNESAKVQWEWPWGWAPNQLLAVEGLRRYGFADDADRVALEWLSNVIVNFRREGTIREKYNVVTRSSEAEIQAGYRQNVIGFGWTNGVFLELLNQLPPAWKSKLAASP